MPGALKLALPMLMAAVLYPATTASTGLEATRMSFGKVNVDPGDVHAAREEGEASSAAARTVLGLPEVRFDIVEAQDTALRWGEQSPAGVPVYVWPFRRNADSRLQTPPAYLLRHEIGHDLFVRYLVSSTKSGQYGGDAPDWLDEMAAVAFEGESLRRMRRRIAARLATGGKFIPLRRFLTMVHPELAAGSIPETSGRLGAAFEAASEETSSFYAMTSAFYDFLVARTGNAAIIAELAGVIRKGEQLEPWLLARTGHADRADDLDALNADFLAWIAADSRYGAEAGQ